MRDVSWDFLALLDDSQRELLAEFTRMLLAFNARINLISREDEAHVYEHHIVHSLFLTYRCFPSGATIVDWGTGGGLPAIPLAIAFPDVRVLAVDSVHKKVRAVRTMARRLGLRNLEAVQSRAEAFEAVAAYSVSRAAAPLGDLWAWHRQLAPPESPAAEVSCWPPGLICLKGGHLKEEIGETGPGITIRRIDLSELSDDPHFREKAILVCTAGTGSVPEADHKPGTGLGAEPGADPVR